jgi:hypothetical protein
MTDIFSPEQDGQLTIHTLRIKGGNPDRLTTQLRAAYAFETASLHPTGLSPAAILCVRSLRDPHPGGFPVTGHAATASSTWQRAVTHKLEQLTRQAIHPLHTPVPANAEAILFADRAELLACLTRDWLDRGVAQRWWWRMLYGVRLDQTPASAWLAAPEYVPGALAHLAAHGQAVAFVHTLNAQEARELWQAVTRRFGLHTLKVVLEERIDTSPYPLSDDTGFKPAPAPIASEPGFQSARLPEAPDPFPTAPWEQQVPESRASGLGVEQRTFLGIGLLLHRAPEITRTPAFLATAATWRKSVYQTPSYSESVSEPSGPREFPSLSKTLGEKPGSHRPPREDPSENAVHPQKPPDEFTESPLTGTSLHDASRLEGPPVSPVSVSPEPPFREALHFAPVTSRYAGIFYLINLALALDLYGDFTRPAHPGISLNLWDFLTLLGQALGRTMPGDELENDPIWDLLADLAHRPPSDLPGKNFTPPDWRIPPDWLKPFSQEVEGQGTAEQQPSRADGPFEFQAGEGSDSPGAASQLERWMGWLMPYIRARLALALAEENPAQLFSLVCATWGKIFITTTHLDVVFSLEALPLQVRLAGLDRNPGWVPAAGRIITFSYD